LEYQSLHVTRPRKKYSSYQQEPDLSRDTVLLSADKSPDPQVGESRFSAALPKMETFRVGRVIILLFLESEESVI